MNNKHNCNHKEHHNCNHSHHCEEECSHHCHHIKCPICGYHAINVPLETIKYMTQMENLEGKYYICANPHCEAVYFNEQYIFNKCDIITKVWYKSKMEDFIVCYCHNIKLVDIIKAVKALKGNQNQEEILKYLDKKIENNDCLHKNPVGTSCQPLMDNAIEFAYDVYIKNKQEEK